MKFKAMILSFFASMVSAGWAQVLDPDSVCFQQGELYAELRTAGTQVELSVAFLFPGQDLGSLSWSTSSMEVKDASIRVSPDEWFTDQVPKGGILLLRFGPEEVIWGIRQLELVEGENLVGTWGTLTAKRISLPEGVEFKESAMGCTPLRIEADAAQAGGKGLVMMPFDDAGGCSVTIAVDGGKPVNRPVTALCLPGFRSWSLQDLNLIKAGFTGGSNPVLSDRIWKLDAVTGEVYETYWYRSTDQSWRSTREGYPEIQGDVFYPGDIIAIKPRVSRSSWVLSPPSI